MIDSVWVVISREHLYVSSCELSIQALPLELINGVTKSKEDDEVYTPRKVFKEALRVPTR